MASSMRSRPPCASHVAPEPLCLVRLSPVSADAATPSPRVVVQTLPVQAVTWHPRRCASDYARAYRGDNHLDGGVDMELISKAGQVTTDRGT
jgi:hypothetical protein